MNSEILIYQNPDGNIKIDVRLENETVWLTQEQMALLFGKAKSTINEHIQNIYQEGELAKEGTLQKFGNSEFQQKAPNYYNLDVIISVGYRVKSVQGTQFRIWATQRLKEYIIKGFALNDDRLKNPPGPGVPDHFDELLERIRDIRASERRMYLRVREIFALAADYEPKDEETQTFFSTIQNKLHFAVTGKTAPELIADRARHEKPNMGLTSWKGDVVRRGDVNIAKNYLMENEISELNRIVTMFLDFAEDQAKRRKQVFMKDWKQKLDDFLTFNDRSVLPGPGAISRENADRLANEQYDHFEKSRRSLAEAKGEADAMKQLEATAKKLSQKKPAKKNKK